MVKMTNAILNDVGVKTTLSLHIYNVLRIDLS